MYILCLGLWVCPFVLLVSFLCWFLEFFFFDVVSGWWWRQYAPLKRRSTIILYGSISQKTTLNINVATRHKTTTYIHGRLISANHRQRMNFIPKSHYTDGRRSVQIKVKSGTASLCCIRGPDHSTTNYKWDLNNAGVVLRQHKHYTNYNYWSSWKSLASPLVNSPATRHGGVWGDRRYSSYSLLTLALGGGEWSASRPDPGTHWTGGWVCLRAGMDTEVRGKILCPCRESNPDRPVVQSVVRHHHYLLELQQGLW
jgi:hypothetical protein